jgi:hypothetical protein
MKAQILLIFLVVTLLQSCIITHQVFEVSSNNVNQKNNDYIFENDSLKISYDLWSYNGGTMKYTIFNKTDKPFYIDWKFSNYIWNGYSIDYWQDIETSKNIGIGIKNSNQFISVTNWEGFSVVTKENPSAQIPPKSQITISKFNINHPKIDIQKIKKIKSFDLEKDSSTLNFRNYLALSFDKNLDNLFFVDNEFWVSKVHIMNDKTFLRGEYPNAKSSTRQFHRENKRASSGVGVFGALIGIFLILIMTTI